MGQIGTWVGDPQDEFLIPSSSLKNDAASDKLPDSPEPPLDLFCSGWWNRVPGCQARLWIEEAEMWNLLIKAVANEAPECGRLQFNYREQSLWKSSLVPQF